MALMQISTREVNDVTILHLKGRLVMDEGDVPLRNEVLSLVKRGRVNLVLDMREVSRLDSAGIGTLVSCYLTTHRHGGGLKLLQVSDRTSQLLDITRLAGVLECYATEQGAIRSFGMGDSK